jgi:hypothetical protein
MLTDLCGKSLCKRRRSRCRVGGVGRVLAGLSAGLEGRGRRRVGRGDVPRAGLARRVQPSGGAQRGIGVGRGVVERRRRINVGGRRRVRCAVGLLHAEKAQMSSSDWHRKPNHLL